MAEDEGRLAQNAFSVKCNATPHGTRANLSGLRAVGGIETSARRQGAGHWRGISTPAAGLRCPRPVPPRMLPSAGGGGNLGSGVPQRCWQLLQDGVCYNVWVKQGLKGTTHGGGGVLNSVPDPNPRGEGRGVQRGRGGAQKRSEYCFSISIFSGF